MKYPNFLQQNQTIGTCAPSFGVAGIPYANRYAIVKDVLKEKGFNLSEGKYIYGINQAQSTTKENRAQDFMEMYLAKSNDFLISIAGGERMLDILEYLDFEVLKKAKPKYFMGYSDNTNLTFLLTTICDIATIYGLNIIDFGRFEYDQCLNDHLELITGKKLSHTSYPLVEYNDLKEVNYFASYNLEFPNKWLNLFSEDEINLEGRIIGGCLDVLVNLAGTKYDYFPQFVSKYQNDGIILYLEVCDFNPLAVYRSLKQLQFCDWFKNITGVIFGRPNNSDELFDFNHHTILQEFFKDFKLPVITMMDFGHVPPMFPIINGAMCKITNNAQISQLSYTLKP